MLPNTARRSTLVFILFAPPPEMRTLDNIKGHRIDVPAPADRRRSGQLQAAQGTIMPRE
jgi:hypothetical protein